MKKILAAVLVGCLIAPQLAFGGAWTLPKGDVWMQQQMKWFWSKRDYDNNGDKTKLAQNARSWGWAMIPEVHYGITDWLDFLFKMEYKEAQYKEYARPNNWGTYSVKNHGLVSIEPGVKVRFLSEPMVLSGQFTYSIWNKHYEDKPLEDVAEKPGISDRSNYWDVRALAGKTWDTAIPFYMGLEWGYRNHTRNIEDQMPLFYEVGIWPLKFLLIKTEIDCMFGMTGTTSGDNVLKKSWAIWRIGPAIELVTLYDMLRGVDVSAENYTNIVTRTGKSLNVEVQYGNTFWGRNTSDSQEVVFKVSTQF
jgi:hypothetical protein